MEKEFTNNQEELVTYNLDKIDKDETVKVNLKDLVYVYRTLQEYVRFFHQPMHYQDLKDVHEFLGTIKEPGGFKILSDSVYEKMAGMIPEHVEEMFGNGEFDHPKFPFYYNENR